MEVDNCCVERKIFEVKNLIKKFNHKSFFLKYRSHINLCDDLKKLLKFLPKTIKTSSMFFSVVPNNKEDFEFIKIDFSNEFWSILCLIEKQINGENGKLLIGKNIFNIFCIKDSKQRFPDFFMFITFCEGQWHLLRCSSEEESVGDIEDFRIFSKTEKIIIN